MTKFQYSEEHQSYPGRYMETNNSNVRRNGLTCTLAKKQNEEDFGVTISLDTKYRKPVPYKQDLIEKEY